MGKRFARLALALLVAFMQATAFAAPIPVRGIVEGFYGKPWTQAQRLDMMAFCESHGLNAYIYAPKDDAYHRAKWREPYPSSQLKKLGALAAEAKKHGVRFIFAVSPGLDFVYDESLHGMTDRAALQDKLEALYGVGVRDFAIFFDDVEKKDGHGQAALLRWLDERFVKTHDGVSPLLTVPTEYFLPDMEARRGVPKPYTKDFSEGLAPDMPVLFTGDGVAREGVPADTLDRTAKLYRRRLGLWWNYPVNDYMEAKLALGPVEKLPKDAEIPAIFFNPMTFAELSKISLATGAAYALSPESYEPEAAWQKAIEEQYGTLAPEMRLFAGQSQHLENNWAKMGPPDGAVLRADMDALWRAWDAGENVDEQMGFLRQKIDALEDAAKVLQSKLPGIKRRECKHQLKQLARLAEADHVALDLLEALRAQDEKHRKKLTAKLERKLEQITQKEGKAKLSETVCRAFIEETLQRARK